MKARLRRVGRKAVAAEHVEQPQRREQRTRRCRDGRPDRTGGHGVGHDEGQVDVARRVAAHRLVGLRAVRAGPAAASRSSSSQATRPAMPRPSSTPGSISPTAPIGLAGHDDPRPSGRVQAGDRTLRRATRPRRRRLCSPAPSTPRRRRWRPRRPTRRRGPRARRAGARRRAAAGTPGRSRTAPRRRCGATGCSATLFSRPGAQRRAQHRLLGRQRVGQRDRRVGPRRPGRGRRGRGTRAAWPRRARGPTITWRTWRRSSWRVGQRARPATDGGTVAGDVGVAVVAGDLLDHVDLGAWCRAGSWGR